MKRLIFALAGIVLGLSAPVHAAEFYTLKLKTRLEYSSLSSGTLTMGRASGRLSGRDDGAFLEFSVDDETVPATFVSGWKGERNRPNLNLVIPYESLRRIMHVTNGSAWRNSRTEAHVTELIDRYINAELARADGEYSTCEENRAACGRDNGERVARGSDARACGRCTRRMGKDVSVTYVDHSYTSDTDNTVIRIQFHDNRSAESLHLVIDFANKVKTL